MQGDQVFVSGGFLDDMPPLDGGMDFTARWDGTAWRNWQFKEVHPWVTPQVMAASSNRVCFGGWFAFQPVVMTNDATINPYPGLPVYYNLATWDGTNWGTLGENGVRDIRNNDDGVVRAIAFGHSNDVFVAGDFLMATPTGIATNIVHWTGSTWEPLGPGLSVSRIAEWTSMVKDIAVADDGSLYAVGDFTMSGSQPVRFFARWDGTQWLQEGAEPGTQIVQDPDALLCHGRDVYVTATIYRLGRLPYRNIAKWNGQFWSPIGHYLTNGVDGYVYSLAADDHALYLGGNFHNADGQPSEMVAEYDFDDTATYIQVAGSVSDDGLPTGAALSLQWTKVSGPGEVTFKVATAASTGVRFSQAGSYVLRLTASDGDLSAYDEVSIMLHTNNPPFVSAGADLEVNLGDTVFLKGKVSDDGLPANAEVPSLWTQEYGLGTAAFQNASQPETPVSFNTEGTYILRLTANDSQFSALDEITVTVLPANKAPEIWVSANPSGVALGELINLSGWVRDDGLPLGGKLAFAWRKLSGPGEAVFSDAQSTNTTVCFSQVGNYVLRLTATDSQCSSSSDVSVYVMDLDYTPAVVTAGPDQQIVWPATASLHGGVVTNSESLATRVLWSVISGPGEVEFANQYAASTTAAFSEPGVYELEMALQEKGRFWITIASDRMYVVANAAVPANQAPMAWTAPTLSAIAGSTISLTAQATDDGLPSGLLNAQWTQLDGPVAAVISQPNALTTPVVFPAAGTYQLQVAVNDSALIATSVVVVTVTDAGAANQPPMVDAGFNQTVAAGSTVYLHGTAADDGLPWGGLNIQWRLARGPTVVSFYDPIWPDNQVTLTVPGEYVFRLHADDGALIAEADVTVTVTATDNQAPMVDAGAPQVIHYPTNTVTLQATVSDDGKPAGGALTYAWEVESYNGTASIDNPTALNPTVTFTDVPWDFSFARNFTLRLTVSDSEVTTMKETSFLVESAGASFHTIGVDAGADQTIQFPAAASLSGYHDFLNEGHAYWTLAFGPAEVVFDDAWSMQTGVHFAQAGTYILRYSAFDWGGNGSDEVVITVLPADNLPPMVDAGPGFSLCSTNPVTTLHGFASDDGLPAGSTLSSAWAVASGPGTVTFGSSNALETTASFSASGSYLLRLTATDGALASSSDVRVIVYDAAQANQPPVIDPGADQTVVLPNRAQLSATVTDDGLSGTVDNPIVTMTYAWSLVAGPAEVEFTQPNAPQTEVQFAVAGDYVLSLSANDGQLDNYGWVRIHVLPATNLPPQVIMYRPRVAEIATGGDLYALAIDDGKPADGSLAAQWSLISGPGSASFTPAVIVSNVISSHAMFSVAGDYQLQLVASDGALSTTGLLAVTVMDVFHGNQAPVVEAGVDCAVATLRPLNLSGLISDDGLPVNTLSSLWSVQSGPGQVRFGDATQTNTTATFYLAGTYVLSLAACDGQRTASDALKVTVANPTNQPPFVFAGLDQEITRPASAYLLGTVLNDGLPLGATVNALWTKVSGPGAATFFPSANSQMAWAQFSAPGTYVLRLTGDDTVLTATSELTVIVHEGVNQPPTVNLTPTLAATYQGYTELNGVATDDGLPNGTLETWWSQDSGPTTVHLSTLNGVYRVVFQTGAEPKPTLPATYVLRLTATDGQYTNSADVTITVYDAPDAPVAQLLSPADAISVTAPIAIIGTASSPLLSAYTVEYRLKPAEGADETATPGTLYNWTVLATGTASVVSNTLAVFDPTLLLNGIYELRLTATDATGRATTTDPTTLVVERNLKIGQFTVSFQDLAVPVAGLPIQIVRTYDSRAAAAGLSGDFGPGWTLDISNIRLQKNRSLARNWTETTTGSPWDLSLAYHLDPGSARIVTITFPDGKVAKFQLTPNPMDQALLPIDSPQWNFTPLGNTQGTLVPATYGEEDGNFLYFAGAIPGTADLYDLNYFFDAFSGSATLDDLQRYPTLFRYTTVEGYQYLIDEVDGLHSVTDPNGNTLVLSTNGLVWSNSNAGSNTVTVAFQRDAAGRITNIVDVVGNSLRYQYDARGNLAGFTDRAGQTNGFVYAYAAFPHHLTGIVDARGIMPVQNQYDASGRLVANIDAYGQTISYGHDFANNREYVTNRLGYVTASDYDDHGNVTHTIDPLGAETFTEYDANGNVLRTIDALGRTNSYTYDERDNRTSVTDPLGHTTRFTYNELRRVTSVTDPRGNTITNAFDEQGNLLAMADPYGRVTTFAYNKQGMPLAMTNAVGQVMRFAYDDNGNLASETDATGHETSYTRDGSGHLLAQATTRTTPQGLETLTAQFQYDTQGRLTNSIFPDGSSAQTIYNAIGKAARTIDQQGRQTAMEYDELGRLVRTVYPDGTSDGTAYDIEGRRVASTNRMGQATRFEYDAVGRLYRTLNFDGTSNTNYFDLAGQMAASTDARGYSTFYGYDAAGRSIAVTNALGQVSRSFYDASGNLTNSVDALGRSTTFVYDALNRRVQTVYADGTTSATMYDELGRRVYETDQAGKPTAFGYDPLGRMIAVTNAMGQVTRFAYDELGQQVSQTDANNHTTAYEYDSLGRRVKRTLPGGEVETCAYNVGGQLASRTDFNGFTTTFQYDLMNRLVAKVPDPRRGEASVTFAYNVFGQRTNMTDASGVTTYAYDANNRLAQKTRTWPWANQTTTLAYSYDLVGSLAGIQSSDANGANVAYEHDALGRLGAVVDPSLGRTDYQYDGLGNLQNCAYPNGVSSYYQYDSLNRLTNLAGAKLLTPLVQYVYTVGASGNRLTASERLLASAYNTHAKTIDRVYAYDDVYRLTGETVNGTATAGAARYGYDPVGNRLSRGSTLPALGTQSFTFDANDRLNSDTYDPNGNTLVAAGFGQTQADRYDFENRLVRRQTAAGTVSIQYDGEGNRVGKIVTTATNTVVTLFVVDEQNPTGYAQVLEELESVDGAALAVSRVYTYGHTLISQDRRDGPQWQASFYGVDGHHNVRYLTDANGVVTDTYDYDAFGNLIAATGTTPNRYLYSGEQYDADLALYYLRARYHNPDTGRFWSMDSYEGEGSDPGTLHKYTYCGNNPGNLHDPSGHLVAEQEEQEVLELAPLVQDTAKSVVGRIVFWGALTSVYATGIVTSENAVKKAELEGIALNLNTKVMSQEEVNSRVKEDGGGYVYFAHGTASGSWGTSTQLAAIGKGDFGRGFYAFALDINGFRFAANRARQKAQLTDEEGENVGGFPFVLIVRMAISEYEALTRIDLESYDRERYEDTIYQGRHNTLKLNYNVIKGPVATKNAWGQYRARTDFPRQYKFDAYGTSKLEPFALIPVI